MDVRNIMQAKLFGEPGVESSFGTGFVPKDCVITKSLMRGVTDAYDTVQIRHCTQGVEDGISTFHFKSYEQGRIGFQGDQIDFGWGDEESPKDDVYMEFLTRLANEGILYTTYTPIFGSTTLTLRFTEPDKNTGFMHPDRGLTKASLDEPDITHFTEEEKAKRRAQYEGTYEYDTRIHGTPMAGHGRVFKISDSAVKEAAVQHIPAHWFKIWGIDFGIGHPFAAVLLLWDKDVDIIHVHHAFRMHSDDKMSLPLHHALAMKPIGGEVPVAWPHDGNVRDKGSGEALKDIYKKHGLKMLHEHSQWEEGGYSTEAGIKEMEERMATGRLKVADHLSDWFQEFNDYHRKDGQVVKVRDDLMSATRIAIMHKRFARNVQLGPAATAKRRIRFASGINDWDVFDGPKDTYDIFTGENPFNDPFNQWR
jgi:phage terminase large subunit-like protein